MQVLKGSEETLRRQRPIVSIEVGGEAMWDGNTHDAIAFLTELKYAPYEMTLDGFLRPHTIAASYTYDNLVWVPEEKIPDIGRLLASA